MCRQLWSSGQEPVWGQLGRGPLGRQGHFSSCWSGGPAVLQAPGGTEPGHLLQTWAG